MITETIEQQLEKENISLNDFRELVIRLLNYSVLCRQENQTEQQLYDRYLRIEALVNEYLALMGVQVLHDTRFEYIRLYPPSSQVPGMEEADLLAFSGSLRSRLSQQEVALILVLRLQYDKALREAKVDDEGFVTESFESISIAMKNIIGRSLPEKAAERRQLFSRCRKLRLIDYHHEDDVLKSESWLKIHPMIVGFVNDEAIQALESPADDIKTDDKNISTQSEPTTMPATPALDETK
ncbi:MAG: DUF4194 domain-containing protein [Gammaproteobacteria bacterium]|nr:DUF4194 domain-containing protein [Gammaproteobacteria bacterium]